MLRPLELMAVTPAGSPVSSLYFCDSLNGFTGFRFHSLHFDTAPKDAAVLHFENKPQTGFQILGLETVRQGHPVEHILVQDPRGFCLYVLTADILNILLETDIIDRTIQTPLYYNFDGFHLHLLPSCIN